MGQSAASALVQAKILLVCLCRYPLGPLRRLRPEASSLGRREIPAPLLPGSKYLQDVKPGSDGQRRIGQPRVRKLRVLHHQYAWVWAACAAPKAAKLQLELLAAPSPAKTSPPHSSVKALRTKRGRDGERK